MPDQGRPSLLSMSGIRKSFPGVQAISSASLDLGEGEIHALVGENGAGKSTLIKILTGVHQADSGAMTIAGVPCRFRSPVEAQAAGIVAIYQEFTLVPSLSVRANLFLGSEKTRRGLIDDRHEQSVSAQAFDKLGIRIDPEALVSELTVAQQQLVEIARALTRQARILVMDEPTAAIAPREVAHLFTILRDLAARGIGILFISHRLDEVFAIADRITVMRDGNTIDTRQTGAFTRQQLIEAMVGRSLSEEYPKVPASLGKIRLEVTKLSGGKVRDVSFATREGEVLGLGGLMGAGRTELARLIFGADKKEEGDIRLDGQAVRIESPRDAIRNGICLLTEDRKLQGLVLGASAKDNFALPNLASWSHLSWINQAKEKVRFFDRVKSLNVRLAGADQRAQDLSGGNQQKLLVARWLETNSQVIIFDEPTRGIDVGAKYEMYLLINKLAAEGKVVLVISSELPELLGICDRILVMREGRISGEIQNVKATKQEDIMALAV